jgi:hypothetical protein
MTNEPFYTLDLKRAPLSVGQPGEKLFEFLVGRDRYLFELRDHGELYGVECQIFKNKEFLAAHRFEPRLDTSRLSRELAIRVGRRKSARRSRKVSCNEREPTPIAVRAVAPFGADGQRIRRDRHHREKERA